MSLSSFSKLFLGGFEGFQGVSRPKKPFFEKMRFRQVFEPRLPLVPRQDFDILLPEKGLNACLLLPFPSGLLAVRALPSRSKHVSMNSEFPEAILPNFWAGRGWAPVGVRRCRTSADYGSPSVRRPSALFYDAPAPKAAKYFFATMKPPSAPSVSTIDPQAGGFDA